MEIYLNILIIILNAIVFSVGQGPIILVSYARTFNLISEKDKYFFLRTIVISIILGIISIYNICAAVLDPLILDSNSEIYITLFAGVLIVFLSGISTYVIVEYVISNTVDKFRKIIQSITLSLMIIFAILLIFIMMIDVGNSEINLLYHTINIYYPIMLAGIGIIGILSMVFFNKNNIIKFKKLALMIAFIPLCIVDVFILQDLHFQTISIGFGIFAVILFGRILKSVIGPYDHKEKVLLSDFIKKHSLTDRESEVLLLAAKGHSNKKISEELFVSIHTVKNHMQKIFSKLSIKSRHELIEIAKDVEV